MGEGAALGSVAFWLFHGVDLNPSSPPSSDHAAPVAFPFPAPSLPVPAPPEPAEASGSFDLPEPLLREGAVLVVVGSSEADPVDEPVEPGAEDSVLDPDEPAEPEPGSVGRLRRPVA